MTQATEQAFQKELIVAKRLATEAGAIVMTYHGRKLEIELKTGNEPVTIADKEASRLIVDGLRREFPLDVIISEENADDARRLTAKRVWYIDPIDGTKDFIRGEDGFCVMIGLAIDHRPAVGVVFGPAGGRLFEAAPQLGAWLTVPGQDRVPIGVSSVDDLSQARLVLSKSHRSAAHDRAKDLLGIRSEHNIGSVGLKLGLIALGARDLYVNPSTKCSSWDTCGPEAVLVEAGGRLSDVHGELLRYDQQQLQHTRGMLASNGTVHDAAVAKLAPMFPPSA